MSKKPVGHVYVSGINDEHDFAKDMFMNPESYNLVPFKDMNEKELRLPHKLYHGMIPFKGKIVRETFEKLAKLYEGRTLEEDMKRYPLPIEDELKWSLKPREEVASMPSLHEKMTNELLTSMEERYPGSTAKMFYGSGTIPDYNIEQIENTFKITMTTELPVRNFEFAIISLRLGHKVRLPEWRGYWFLDNENNIKSLTKEGEITDAWVDKAKKEDRKDWEIAEGLDFGWAITALKAGKLVTRKGWNGKGMWLELQSPDEHSKMTLPYIFMKTACNNRVPWLASQSDVLSDDWQLFDPETV